MLWTKTAREFKVTTEGIVQVYKETEETVRSAQRELQRVIRKAKRECWEEYLNRAEGEDVWAVSRYRKPQRSAAVPTIRHRGVTAERHEEKARMLMDISFPTPTRTTVMRASEDHQAAPTRQWTSTWWRDRKSVV